MLYFFYASLCCAKSLHYLVCFAFGWQMFLTKGNQLWNYWNWVKFSTWILKDILIYFVKAKESHLYMNPECLIIDTFIHCSTRVPCFEPIWGFDHCYNLIKNLWVPCCKMATCRKCSLSHTAASFTKAYTGIYTKRVDFNIAFKGLK